MKKLLPLFFIFSGLSMTAKAQPFVRQEIRYASSEATEVFMVWGMNNWQLPASMLRPEGSFIKDKLLYTPMKRGKDGFSADLILPSNTLLDYVFWITRGPAGKTVDIWDVNKAPQKDYHSLVLNNNTILITPAVNVRPKEALTLLDFAMPLLSVSAVLFFFLLIIRTRRLGNIPLHSGPAAVVTASAMVLAFFLILIRSSVTGESWDLYLHPSSSFSKVIWAGFYDFIYTLVLAFFFLFLLRLFRNRKKIRSALSGTFVILCLISLIAGILNIRVVETIGKPFNYPWFYYSDFLNSVDAHAAIASNLSFSYFIQVLMICSAAFFLGMSIVIITDLVLQRLQIKPLLISSLLCCSIAYVTLGPGAVDHYHWDYNKLANPLVAFVRSVGPFSGDPELFTMNIADSLRFNLFINKNFKTHAQKKSGIKNVLLFVMESTPAEYIQPYAAAYKITPELEKYLPEAVVFDNIYAHAPATNNSMVSILGSVYPWLSYNSITKEYPGIKIPTISSELKQLGYRTSFFNSADNRFQKAGEFLEQRKFDAIKDCNTLQCKQRFEVKDEKWDYLDGKNDECTAEELVSWIGQKPEMPFFTMMWTYQTHYPYFVSGEEEAFVPSDPILNRYLNAVHHSDAVLGKIIKGLKEKGLYESTLIVVVGDHGEAFGRHNQTTHASGIYEENLHVPCILINPAFKGEHQNGIGGLVDIAPTIMNLLGYSSSEKWQGKDLFTAKKNDRVYFFTPWSDYLFGYREGNKKYIFNATKNLTEMYDLEQDPFEKNNIAAEFPDAVDLSHQRIAGWVQSLNKYIGTLIAVK